MAGYGDAYYDSDEEADCSPHPTRTVLICSANRELTAHACRGCDCTKIQHHEYGCKAGFGPLVTREMRMEFHDSVSAIVKPKVVRIREKARKSVLDEMSDRYGLGAAQRDALLTGRDR